MILDTDYFAQRIQCSRDDKQECLRTVCLLVEIATVARQEGVKALDVLLAKGRMRMPFLNKAVQLYMDAKDSDQIRTVLYNRMVVSNFSGAQFLNAVIITEAIAALHDQEDIDYIFSYLVPSYFGMDFENSAYQAYQDCRRSRFAKLRELFPDDEDVANPPEQRLV